MTWGKNDDGLAEHPKFRGLSLRAIGLWTVCRSYAAQHETDGYLATDIVREKVGRHSRGSRVNTIAQELVDAGLWDVAIGGWMIHDYADWNRTKIQKDARREAAAERQRRHRETEAARLVRASCAPSVPLAQASDPVTPAQRVVSRRDSRSIEVEEERELPETSSLVAPTLSALQRTPRHAGDVIAAWVEHRGGRQPNAELRARVGRVAREQLQEGTYPPDAIKWGVIAWADSGFGLGMLSQFMDQQVVPPKGVARRIGSRTDQMLTEASENLDWAREMDTPPTQGELA